MNERRESHDSWRMSKELFANAKKHPEELRIYPDRVSQFYAQQNEHVEKLLTTETLDVEGSIGPHVDLIEKDARHSKRAKVAIKLSFIANIVLFFMKVYAAISSGSLSFVASALESFLDLFSGLIFFLTSYYTKNSDRYLYPAGSEKLEPIGVIIVSSIRFTATFQVIIQFVKIITSSDHSITITTPTIAIIVSTVIIKVILYCYCKLIKNSPSVDAITQDHRNDILSNTFGIITALLGYYLYIWFDGLGGMCIGIYIMINWFRTGYDYATRLTGKTADPSFLQQITYISITHDQRILQIATARAFYLGKGYLVEVDIVLPPDMQLKEAHDIGESLQVKLEKMKHVDRAFVHLDWNSHHDPEH